jgi:hypothetical protein
MGWSAAWLEDTPERFTSKSMHQYTLCHKDARIKATKRLKADKAFVIDMADYKSDLIHVRSDQDFRSVTATLFVPDNIAHGVDVDGIHKRRHRILNYTAHNFFTARYTGSLTDRFKKVKVHVAFLS